MSRPGTSRGPLPTVLLADGDAPSLEHMATLLRVLGCTVQLARTGEEALRMTRRDPPSVVITDIHLPGISGYQLCRELREAHGETLPIMFVSGQRVTRDDEVAGLLVGADDYLVKPLSDDVFLARVRRLLARARTGTGRAPAAAVPSPLTRRETEVLELLVAGQRASEITERLCIAPKTTASHIEHILTKLGAHSQAQAVAFAVRDGIVRSER